jgi:hypothetical protein
MMPQTDFHNRMIEATPANYGLLPSLPEEDFYTRGINPEYKGLKRKNRRTERSQTVSASL